MAQFCRIFLSILHCIIVTFNLFIFIDSMVNGMNECLQPMVGLDGKPIPFDHVKPLCETIVYSNACIAALHLFMCIFLNCSWGNDGILILNLLFTTLAAMASVFCGVLFTSYSKFWCDSLKAWSGKRSCHSAVDAYDQMKNNTAMATFKRQLVVQQAANWGVIPLAVIAILTYAISIMAQRSQIPTPNVQHHHVLIQDETSPLLNNQETVRNNISDAQPPPRYVQSRTPSPAVRPHNTRYRTRVPSASTDENAATARPLGLPKEDRVLPVRATDTSSAHDSPFMAHGSLTRQDASASSLYSTANYNFQATSLGPENDTVTSSSTPPSRPITRSTLSDIQSTPCVASNTTPDSTNTLTVNGSSVA